MSQPTEQSLSDLGVVPVEDLSPREIAIARLAAKLAVKEVTDQFYKSVGRTVIQRALILLGMFVVGFGAARGWIKFTT